MMLMYSLFIFCSVVQLILSSDDSEELFVRQHPSSHTHPDDAVFVYHDYYTRINEGDTARMCATLNRTLDYPVAVDYRTQKGTAENMADGDQDYYYNSGTLVFEPGQTEHCFEIRTTLDDIAGEEDLESVYVQWRIPDNTSEVYFYHSNDDKMANSVVAIKDDDILILTPNATEVTVYEGDYSTICVTADQSFYDEYTYASFFARFVDKDYTAYIGDDLQYTHIEDYPYFYGYGGIYELPYDEEKSCFHFHTKDDNEFEGNEEFSIKLYSFTPLQREDLSNPNITTLNPNPFDLLFNFTDDYEYDPYHNYHHHDDDDHHGDDSCTCDCGCDFGLPYEYFSERFTFDTFIPKEASTIHVTIVDNEEVPCLKENTEPCFQMTEDIMCLYLRKQTENEEDLPRPCRISNGGLLGSLSRYDPHPLRSAK